MRHLDAGLKWMLMHDEAWCVRINGASQVRWVRALFCVVSRLGDGWFWYALMACLLYAKGSAAYAIVLAMLAAGVTGLAVYKVLKATTSRPRPYQVRACIRLGTAPLDHYSFPSGHTLHAVSFTTIALSHFPELGAVLLPFSMLVALSRVVLGLHYPSDVLAGATLGAAIAGTILQLY